MTNNRNYEIVYSDYDESDFYILLGLHIDELIDELKFKVSITYK